MEKGRFEDDLSIFEGCIKRDTAAWAVFVKKYSNLVQIAIDNRLKKYGFTLPCHDIEDIRQDVFVSIWQEGKLDSIQNFRSISYWLAIVSGNAALEYMRKRRRIEPHKSISIFDRMDEDVMADLVPSSASSPSEELIRGEAAEKIEREIEKLPSKEKLVIKLNILYGKKYNEIADILNIPGGTVSNYIKRAKEKLKDELKEFK